MFINKFKFFIFLLFLSILSILFIVYMDLDFNNANDILGVGFSSKSIVFITGKIFLFSIWFLIGIYSYTYLIPQSIISRINKLSFLELFLILFIIFMTLMLIETFLLEHFTSVNSHSLYIVTDNNSNSSSSNSNTASRASDGAIMTAALAGGMKIAQKCPTAIGKIGAVVGSIAAGSAAIITKNIAGTIDTTNIIKKNFISNNQLIDYLTNIFDLTGNHGIDLLNMIQYFNKLQFFFIYFIFYILLLNHINEAKLEVFLGKFLPSVLVKWYIRSVILFKKTSTYFLIYFLIVLTITNYCSYYYLQFFIDNLDKIIELYFKK